MTDTKRYVLLWLGSAFIGVNGGFAAYVVADAFVTLHGVSRTITLWAAFVLASLVVTIAVGRALVRLVAKQLN
ncbi:MAG TPA: hypothetical protein VGM51_11035 [Armatimonadota bacterium]